MTKETANTLGTAALLLVFIAIAVAIFANVPMRERALPERDVRSADANQAAAAIHRYGCGSCHVIPGIAGAQGTVGPKLEGIANHSFLAGQISNTPDHLIEWIMHPQQVRPGSDMPEMGVTEQDARNIAAYLYSIH